VLRLTIPIVPSVNHCYRNVTVSRRILTPKARAWAEEVQLRAKLAARQQGWEFSAGEKLIMELTTYWPDKRRRDTHNAHKLLADSLEGVLYEDDRWVLIRDIDFRIDRRQPRVEITLKRFEEAESVG
jgi:crossover junction endodeoxyribonuclease RusA